MIRIKISTPDHDRAVAALRRGVNLDREIQDEMAGWASDHLDKELYGMENYAPAPAGSKYIRTGRLGSNWGVRRKGKKQVEFYNETPYAGYVVGDGKGRRQAAIHAGRWWLARKRTEDAVPDLMRRIARRVTKVLR